MVKFDVEFNTKVALWHLDRILNQGLYAKFDPKVNFSMITWLLYQILRVFHRRWLATPLQPGKQATYPDNVSIYLPVLTSEGAKIGTFEEIMRSIKENNFFSIACRPIGLLVLIEDSYYIQTDQQGVHKIDFA